ncbi:MAG: ABC transporter permease, partial [Firmicutes bacterium]|nr:ABC transporter permease [Bacillota bacterium]
NMFTSAVQGSCGVVVGKSSLVKKIYFPREILPFAMVGSAAINYALSLIILIPFLIFTGYFPNVYWLYVPILLAVETVVCAGFALFFAAINVYMRDTEHMLNIFMMLWFYVTPVVYSLLSVPKKLVLLFKIDPIAAVILGFQQVFYYDQAPHWKLLLYSIGSSLFILAAGWGVFVRLNRRFAEEV